MSSTLRRLASSAATHAVLIAFAAVALVPLYFVFLVAVKSNVETTLSPLALPQHWQFGNFKDALVGAHMSQFLWNSVLVTVPALALVLSTSSLAGYALARLAVPLPRVVSLAFIAGLAVPSISIAVPLYYTVRSMGLLDTRGGLILAESAQALPIAVFIMRAAFRDLPGELRDAALVDGGGELTSFLRVMLPLARSAVVAVSVLTFLTVWNDYLIPLILINNNDLRTLPLGLTYLQGKYVTNYALVAAGTLLTALPSIAIYAVLQRQFLRGVVQGSIR